MSSERFIFSNAILTEDEKKHNAAIIFRFFRFLGWTKNAIAGMVGNMDAESYLNPGVWEMLEQGVMWRGFGLTQWTPATKLTDWADITYGIDSWRNDGYIQLQRIAWEWRTLSQFAQSEQYPFYFDTYAKLELSPEEMGICFLLNYERPAIQDEGAQQARAALARKWYDYFDTLQDVKPFPLWLLFKFRR